MKGKKFKKIYFGVKDLSKPRPLKITVIGYDTRDNILKTYQLEHIERHSPDGFNWGYGGSGPADTALSILYDYTQDMSESLALYQELKNDFIAGFEKCLGIFSFELDKWLTKKRKEIFDAENKHKA